jgi:lipoprotein-releasing system ATP-binding protein
MVDNSRPVKSDDRDGAARTFLRAVGLTKCFDGPNTAIQILNQLDLELAAGERLAIVGASGIGKSTLLHVLGTLDRPDSGALNFQGEDVFQFDDLQLARFRNRTMLPEFSALENTMMPALIQGIDQKKAAGMAEAILVRVGLAERLHQRATELSGGEQQRVALARALILRPALLLADEPTGNLDKSNSRQVHQLLLELNREMGMALVVVTHNMELAAYMNRQATITDGRLAYLS